jgi:hypothetical protein
MRLSLLNEDQSDAVGIRPISQRLRYILRAIVTP